MRMHAAYIGIGSNLQDPVRQVRAAFAALGAIEGTCVAERSSLYRSAPVGFAEQPDFVNAVARIETRLDAFELLDRLLATEQAAGRTRVRANGPRTLDLDLLLFDDARIETPRLSVPHPRMHSRAFVLIPLTEIAPAIAIPGRGPAAECLARIGPDRVERIAA